MLAPGWGTGTRGGSPPGVKLGSLPVYLSYDALMLLHTICVFVFTDDALMAIIGI